MNINEWWVAYWVGREAVEAEWLFVRELLMLEAMSSAILSKVVLAS